MPLLPIGGVEPLKQCAADIEGLSREPQQGARSSGRTVRSCRYQALSEGGARGGLAVRRGALGGADPEAISSRAGPVVTARAAVTDDTGTAGPEA